MTLAGIAAKNLLRNKFRTAMTFAGIGFALIGFLLVRTVVTSWNSAVDHAAKDRIGTRHKVTFIMPLPRKYVDDIRATPGVQAATWANWFGGKDPKRENEFFATIAVDIPSFLEVYKEIELEPGVAEAWKANRRGAVIGDVLAKKFGWKPGDKVTLQGSIFPGDWEFEIVGIYKALERSVDRSTFWFDWNYLNDWPQRKQKDTVGWIVSRVDDPTQSGAISQKIDKMFDERDEQTVTMSEKAMQQSFMGMFSAILKALDVVSIVILLIMLLIIGNTIAMGVRERTNEYGMMRAIGYPPGTIGRYVVLESSILGLLGGLVGAGLGFLLINFGMGPFIEENMGLYFPFFRVAGSTVIIALACGVGLGAIAGALPAWRAAKLDVIQALRKVG